MNRRKFLKVSAAGAIIPASFAAATVTAKSSCDKRQCIEHFKDHHICWTGWKPAVNSFLVTAQWVAYPINRKEDGWQGGIYSSIPGSVSPFHVGDCFDLTLYEHQPREVLDCSLAPADIEKQQWAIKAKADALLRLKKVLSNR